MRGVLRAVIHPMMRSRGIGILDSLTTVPRPSDEPRAHASGVDADRVLLLGAGPAVGWGMAANDLALPGALARAVTAITGRGSDVDVVSAPVMSALMARDALSNVKLWRYDAVVLTLGLNEAVQLASIETWLRDLAALLDALDEGLSPYAQVYVLGVHSLTRVGIVDRLVERIASQHLRAFNRATSEIVADTERATFVPFDVDREGETVRTRTAKDYQHIARLLAAAMAPALEIGWSKTANTPAREQRASDDEEARLAAVSALEILDSEPEDQFDKLVALTRQVFGTGSAALTIVARDRQWTKAGAGPFTQDASLASSICRATISTASGLILADASTDERFTDVRAGSNGPLVRFYAGFPIEAPTGERIGALCVFDAETRDPSDIDRALLRDLALLAQSEIWARAAG